MDVVPVFGRGGDADSVVDASGEVGGEVVCSPVLTVLLLVEGVVGVGGEPVSELAGGLGVSQVHKAKTDIGAEREDGIEKVQEKWRCRQSAKEKG
jgi:hypothetical protein